MKLLTVNCGSSSIKLGVFEAEPLTRIGSASISNLGSAHPRMVCARRSLDGRWISIEAELAALTHADALEQLLDRLADAGLDDPAELGALGHRVVHGGDRFQRPVRLDREVLAAIAALEPLAPLHNPLNLEAIELTQRRYPQVAQMVVFDTAFHHTLPAHAFRYAVPAETYASHAVRRYGFHGISHRFASRTAAEHLGKPVAELNLITLHLGSGASIAAIAAGRCVDTSMGMTPLEGLVMGERCGDLDASVPLYLQRQTGRSAVEIEELLSRESGLKGLCGSADMREVEARAASGDADAELALSIFCYRIRKYIGAYHAVLGRVDALVFTGGIGERSATVRERVCEPLVHLGVTLDRERNRAQSSSVCTAVGQARRALAVLVVAADEEAEIARAVVALLSGADRFD